MKKFEPKIKCLVLVQASKKLGLIEPSFSKHVAHEPNFEPSLGSTHPYILQMLSAPLFKCKQVMLKIGEFRSKKLLNLSLSN